jgi:hypothetical protein
MSDDIAKRLRAFCSSFERTFGYGDELSMLVASADIIERQHEALLEAKANIHGRNAIKSTSDLLRWLADRIVNVCGESETVDFVRAAHERANMLDAALAAIDAALKETGNE